MPHNLMYISLVVASSETSSPNQSKLGPIANASAISSGLLPGGSMIIENDASAWYNQHTGFSSGYSTSSNVQYGGGGTLMASSSSNSGGELWSAPGEWMGNPSAGTFSNGSTLHGNLHNHDQSSAHKHHGHGNSNINGTGTNLGLYSNVNANFGKRLQKTQRGRLKPRTGPAVVTTKNSDPMKSINLMKAPTKTQPQRMRSEVESKDVKKHSSVLPRSMPNSRVKSRKSWKSTNPFSTKKLW